MLVRLFKKNRDYGSEGVDDDFLEDAECLSDEVGDLLDEVGDLLDEAECLLDEAEDVCVSEVDEAEEVAGEVVGEVGADTVVVEVAEGVDFVDDDLAGETAPL